MSDDDDDDDDDDNGDWYFGLKGRRSRGPGQGPGYWWTTVMFALKGQKLLQGFLATHRIYPGAALDWKLYGLSGRFFCGTCEAYVLTFHMNSKITYTLHQTPLTC